jgi:hypothetical protein
MLKMGRIFLCCAFIVLSEKPAFADIYKCTGPDGVAKYFDKPCTGTSADSNHTDQSSSAATSGQTSDAGQKLVEYMAQYPKKSLVVPPSKNQKPNLIAIGMITAFPNFSVLGIDASHEFPQKVWVYNGKVYDAKCTAQEVHDDGAINDAADKITRLNMAVDTAKLINFVKLNLRHSFTCVFDENVVSHASSGLSTSGGGTAMISYVDTDGSPAYATYVYVIKDNKYDIFHMAGTFSP